MPKIIVDQDDVIVIKPPLPQLNNHKLSINITNTCFYKAMDCLTDSYNLTPNSKAFLTKKINNHFDTAMNLYAGCSMIQIIIKQRLEVDPQSKQKKFPIDDSRLKKAFSANLKENLQIHQDILSKYNYEVTMNDAETYIDQFFAYCQNKYPDVQKSFAEWYGLTEEFLYHHQGQLAGQSATELLEALNLNQEKNLLTRLQTVTDEHSQSAIKAAFLQYKTAQAYGFEIYDGWQPEHSIDSFISLIKSKGYLLVSGFYAKECYTQKPIKKVIGQLEVLTWPKNSFNNQNFSVGHTVVVIGASKAGYNNTSQDLVYYINPAQDNNLADYPIYIISYENFCKRILSTDNMNVKFAKDSGLNPTNLSFVYSHPKLAPNTRLASSKSNANTKFWHTSGCTKITLAASAVAVTAAIIVTKTLGLS